VAGSASTLDTTKVIFAAAELNTTWVDMLLVKVALFVVIAVSRAV
jgi:hypothetical protein